ncbi:hypothetical protein YC2023_102465 [Brassica napus]
MITFPSTGTIFHQLVHLELSTDKADWWNLLTRMINMSPRLQVLKLIGELYYGKVRVSCKEWNQPKNVPECLETFVWNTYKEQQEEEKEVAKYILRNANRLKKANISVKWFNSDERVEMFQTLQSIVKVSNSSSCHILDYRIIKPITLDFNENVRIYKPITLDLKIWGLLEHEFLWNLMILIVEKILQFLYVSVFYYIDFKNLMGIDDILKVEYYK